MTSTNNERIGDYIDRLQNAPEYGPVMVIRITNKRSAPLSVQIEPTGDRTEPLASDGSFVVVAQGHVNDSGILDIWVGDDGLSIWVEGRDAQVFHNGLSEAY